MLTSFDEWHSEMWPQSRVLHRVEDALREAWNAGAAAEREACAEFMAACGGMWINGYGEEVYAADLIRGKPFDDFKAAAIRARGDDEQRT